MTIKDIAKACGVGVSTVSRVLNNRPDVSPEVRARVLSVVEATGFIPNNSARDLGRSRMAVFLNVSDTDRSMDRLTNLFYAQALHELCESADHYPDPRLPVPVRIYLDDFATNVYIPDFDKIISVIRSREIYVSVILQSI